MNPIRFNSVIYEEAMTLLYQEWDFKVCQRTSDGSYYGTADGNKCRVGTEANPGDPLWKTIGFTIACQFDITWKEGTIP